MSEIKNGTNEEVTAEQENAQQSENVGAKEEQKKPKKEKEDKKSKAELAALREELEKKEKELAEEKDKYLRLMAEYDNFRRRATAERSAAYTDGLEGALEKLLPIFDNLERAALYNEADKVAEGLVLIAKSASEALAALSVETFGEVGDAFDPNLHNAVMHVEDEALGESEIVEVFQKGYVKGDKVIRYAMVKVAN